MQTVASGEAVLIIIYNPPQGPLGKLSQNQTHEPGLRAIMCYVPWY